MIYRWHQPYTEADTFTNGDGLVQSRSLIMRNIKQAKRDGMVTFAYIPMYAATGGNLSPSFQEDRSDVKFAWGAFNDYKCGKTTNCTLTDMAGFGGRNASVANIALMDATNPAWRAYWAKQVGIWIRQYDFDSVFIDTYGNLKQLYRLNGDAIDYNRMLSGFTNAAIAALSVPVVTNGASSWLEQDEAQNSHEAFHFREVWDHPNDISTYDQFHTLANNVWRWAGRKPHNVGLDWDMGLDKALARRSSCQSAVGATCEFSLPGALYLEATIEATGAHHNWLVDGDRFISNDDYPMWGMLQTTPDFLQEEYDYQNFGVAYEKLLRDNVSDSPNSPPIMTGATGATTAKAGAVWMLQKARSGFDILQLINFDALCKSQIRDVQDPNGNYPAPTRISNAVVKMYRTGGATLGNLYIASPDIDHGRPRRLSFTTGSDGGRSYITFTVPSLLYWDMIWLENGVATSDYAAP